MIPSSKRGKNIPSSVLSNLTVVPVSGYFEFFHPVGPTVFLAAAKSMHGARGGRARVSVNFRKFSPCIARAWRALAGLTVYPPSQTLEPVAFDEYCRFDTSAFSS
jgi:hypothetical protein